MEDAVNPKLESIISLSLAIKSKLRTAYFYAHLSCHLQLVLNRASSQLTVKILIYQFII